jgi:glycosyltransferase involved in cell wall biosynthesis
MRILITSDIFPPDVGGPATYVPRIAAECTRMGHQVTVVTYSIAPGRAEDPAYPFRVVRVSAEPPRWRRLPRTLSAILSYGRDVDVIYANGLVTETALANCVLHKPIVAKVVGDLAWERCRDKGWISDDIDTFQTRRYSWKVELMRWRRSWSYRRMDSIVVPSEYLKWMLTQHWGLSDSRVQVIYNSFSPFAEGDGSLALDAEVSDGKIGLSTKYRLITVCRLTGWKGVDGLIRVLPELGSDVGLVVVGDGPLFADLVALAQELGVHERVRFVGTVPREQVRTYLHACHIFILNSTYEGLPHVVLEATAAGLPVIATDAGGTKEVLRDIATAQLVPVGDPAALKTAIQAWLHRLPVSPAPIPERFSLHHMVRETEAALLRAVQPLGPSPGACREGQG